MSYKKKHLSLSEFAVCAQEGSKEEGTHILTIFLKICRSLTWSVHMKACEVSARRCMKRNSDENFTPRRKTQTNTSCSKFVESLRENLEIEVDIS